MMPKVYVLDVPEFRPLIDGARSIGCTVQGPAGGYFTIAAPRELVFARAALGLKPALWYSSLSGGVEGRIAQFDRDTIRIAAW